VFVKLGLQLLFSLLVSLFAAEENEVEREVRESSFTMKIMKVVKKIIYPRISLIIKY